MLFTDANWGELNASRRAIAKPYQPWRCVGWTDEEVCFWVFPEREANQEVDFPDGLLIAGAKTLIDVIAQMPSDSFSVYALESSSRGLAASMRKVTGLYSQPTNAETELDYWYRTEQDDLCPCAALQSSLRDEESLKIVFAHGRGTFEQAVAKQ
jgi:hypothetical protein